MSAGSLEVARSRQHDSRYWTPTRIVEQLRLFEETTGRRPRALDGNKAGAVVRLPMSDICTREFGSWNNAMEAAGFTVVPATGGRKKGAPSSRPDVIRGRNVCACCGDIVWVLRWETGWCVPCTVMNEQAVA